MLPENKLTPEKVIATKKGIETFGQLTALVAISDKLREWEEKIDDAFTNPDGRLWSNRQITEFVIDLFTTKPTTISKTKNKSSHFYIPGYYVFAFLLDGNIDKAKSAAREWVNVQTPLVKFFDDAEGFLKGFDLIAEEFQTVNPLRETKVDATPFTDIASMKVPLSEEDRKKIDMAFSQPQDAEDIAFAIVLKILSTNVGDEKKFGEFVRDANLTPKQAEGLTTIGRIAYEYFAYWQQRVIDTYFDSQATEDAIPDALPLLKYILASSMLNKTYILPDVYAHMLDEGVFGELEDDAKQVLKDAYAQEFDRRYGEGNKKHNIFQRLDDEGLRPYAIASKTAKEGKDISFVNVLLTNELHEEHAVKEFRENFAKIQPVVENLIHTVAVENGIAIDIASYRPEAIDIILTTENHGLALQVTDKGKVYGMPPALADKADALVQFVITKAMEYIKDENLLRSTPKVKEKLTVSSQKKVDNTTNTLIDREASVQDDELVVSRTPKRKALRRMGLIQEVTSSIDEVVSGQTRAYSVSFSPDFRSVFTGYPIELQNLAQQVIARVESGGKGLKKLHLSSQAGVPLFRVRVGKKHRLVFVDSGNNNLMAIKLDNRDDIYEELRRNVDNLANYVHVPLSNPKMH